MTNNNISLLNDDASRRSFLQKGAAATGAVALGGVAGCVSSGEDHDTDEDTGLNDTENDYVVMLYPDAVEHTSGTVVSEEIDWLPWEDDEETDDFEDDTTNDNDVGDDTTDDNDDAADDDFGEDDDTDNDDFGEDDDDLDTEEDYRTHLLDLDFSASHVAPVLVPEDADIEVDGEIQLGEIEELLREPGEPIDGNGTDDTAGTDDTGTGDDTATDDTATDDDGLDDDNDVGNGIGEPGEPVLARIGLEEDTVGDDTTDENDDDGFDDDTDEDDGMTDDN